MLFDFNSASNRPFLNDKYDYCTNLTVTEVCLDYKLYAHSTDAFNDIFQTTPSLTHSVFALAF